MKSITIITVLLVLNSGIYSQEILKELKLYDYKRAEQIARDSLFMKKDVGEDCKFFEHKTDTNIKFEVIPVCYIKKGIEYISGTSILNYLKIDTFDISSIVLYKAKVVGFLEGFFTNRVVPKNRIDSVTGEIFVWGLKSKEIYYGETYKWELRWGSTLCINRYEFQNKIRNFLDQEKPEIYFFSDFFFHPELWFLRGDKLMVYSIAKNKVYEEKKYINGIKKVPYKNPDTGEIIRGKFLYYLDRKW